MQRLGTATALFVSVFLLPASGSQSADTAGALQSAAVAWHEGDYVSALTTYQRLLASADAAAALETIALQTGELFVTTELTTDGAAPQFSPDATLVTYEAGPAGARVIRLVRTDGPTAPIAELHGWGATFSKDGSRLAYLRAAGSGAPPAAPAGPAPARTDTQVVVRALATGAENVLDTGTVTAASLLYAGPDVLLATGVVAGQPQQIYALSGNDRPRALTQGDGDRTLVAAAPGGDAAIIGTRLTVPGGRPALEYSLLDLRTGALVSLETTDRPGFSADGRWVAYVGRDGDAYTLNVRPASSGGTAAIVRRGPERMENAALSADGSMVAYELMTAHDWEIYVSPREGGEARRVTREIQHDVLPRFLSPARLLATIGEPRHRRAYLYDLETGRRTRLFHNNTVRTIAPEYSWTPDAAGTRLLIVAERDGDTVSPERGVYLVDLTRTVTRDQVAARVAACLASERALRARSERMFAPIRAEVTRVLAEASVARVYGYEKALFDFDSKHITQPGNAKASAYLADTYRSFGYDPDFQWFEPRGAFGGRTANVIARLEGTVNPELVYVVSSHYDSTAVGPGADDDSSGTAALLEAARLLATHPQPATILFASFTGEEAGLLGSREFVRRAVAGGVRIAGALNNDMIGWANDDRLDDTIRYSNPGIRDVQHAAALQFTKLITYDAVYYKGTDAAAYYEAYGDIVGGLGSYPVLGNPHYHQPHDVLETVNHQLVTEVARTTAATLMLLASSPARLSNLRAERDASGRTVLSWTPSPERGVAGYIVSAAPPGGGPARETRTVQPAATLTGAAPGTVVSVKAVNTRGLEGWDWARVTVP